MGALFEQLTRRLGVYLHSQCALSAHGLQVPQALASVSLKLSLLPSNGRSVTIFVKKKKREKHLEPSCGKVRKHNLPLSGNYVFYLRDTYSYFNIGYPAVLMGHYSNKWGETERGW